MKKFDKTLAITLIVGAFLFIFVMERKKHDKGLADDEPPAVSKMPAAASEELLQRIVKQIAWVNTAVDRKQLAEFVRQGLTEEKARALFGQGEPMDCGEDDGKTTRTFLYGFAPQVVAQLKAASPKNFQHGFSLEFRDGVLTAAEAHRNVSQNDYPSPDAVRRLLAPGATADSVEAKLGFPRIVREQGEKTIFTYCYSPEISRGFPGEFFEVRVLAVFQEGRLAAVDYEFSKIDFMDQKGKVVLRHSWRRCPCIGPKASDAPMEGESEEAFMPLEQFGIQNREQLEERKAEIIWMYSRSFGSIHNEVWSRNHQK